MYLLHRFLHETDWWPEALYNLSRQVVADWHELAMPQRTMQPSVARVSEQLDPRSAASRQTTAPISHIKPSPRSPSSCILDAAYSAESGKKQAYTFANSAIYHSTELNCKLTHQNVNRSVNLWITTRES